MIIVMGLSMFLRQSLRSALPLSSSSNLASQPYQSPAALAFDLPRMAAAESYGARQAGKAKYSVPYLKLYNTLQMIGWLSASLLTLVGLFSTGDDVWTLAAPTVRESSCLPAPRTKALMKLQQSSAVDAALLLVCVSVNC